MLTKSEMVREKSRYAPIRSRISCGAGYPLPIAWNVMRVISAKPMAIASEVFLAKFRYWLMMG